MTRLLKKLTVFTLALSLIALIGTAAHAQKGGDAASKFIQGLGDKALTSLTASDLPTAEREKRVRELLRSNFDVPRIARFALGTNWKTATEAERAEYLKLFEQMIVKTYAQRFSEYSGQEFKVTGTTVNSDTDTTVASQIIQKGGPPVNVEWRVSKKGGSQKIIDVYVESISMSVTQRSDFAAVIQRGGGKVESLLQSMRERAGQAAE